MNEDRLRQVLLAEPLPDEAGARERAWRLARAAYGSAPRSQSAPPRGYRRLLQGAAVFALIAAFISPAGAAVRHWVRDAVEVGHEPSLPALSRLPAPGSLLVESDRGPWIVREDGSKRLLGDYDQVTWSPRGLFVAATAGHQLLALDPEGGVRWALARGGKVGDPAWSPDGYRIAYLSDRDLRVVAGDGSGDRLLARHVARVAPAWEPVGRHRLSFVDAAGRVRTAQTDSGRTVFETPPGSRPLSLSWSGDGSRLLIARRSGVQLRDRHGAPLWSAKAPAGMAIRAASLAPGGEAVAAIATTPSGAQSELLLLGPGGRERSVFAGLGRLDGLVYSPNGRWLLVGWRSADQWLFVHPARPRRIVAISDISAQFDPGTTAAPSFPALAGWCCP